MRNRNRFSLNTKAFLLIFTLLFGICAVVYSILIINIPASFVKNYNGEIKNEIDSTLQQNTPFESAEAVQQKMQPIADKYSIDITIYDGITYEEVGCAIGIARDEECMREQLDLGYITYTDDESHVYTVDAFIVPGNDIRIRDVLISYIPTIFCIIMGLSIAASFLIARMITRPIQRLSSTSSQLALSDSVNIPYLRRKDEIGQLATSLSNMYQSLQESLEKEHHQSALRDKLFQSVSHELKTPITILQGELEGMLYNMGDYKNRDTYIAHSLEIVQEMAQLVQKILIISKTSTNYTLLVSNASDLIFKQCERYTSLANQKSINLICEADEPVMIAIDKEAFGRAISNLLSNAIKYSPDGATVTAHIDNTSIYIENSGVSIPDDRLNDLFEPFVRLEASHNHDLGGSGLGLYIVKTILDAHGMTYKMENTDIGVRFTINY